jgi:rhodanese-related sulfurtransferase
VLYRLSDAKTLALMDLIGVVAARNLAQVERILRGLSDGVDAPEPVTRAELAERLGEGSVTLFDVRPPDELAMGHIPGARNASCADLDYIAPTLDLGSEIVAYCRGPYCVYSYQAVTARRKRGVIARRLEGGLSEWPEDRRQLVVRSTGYQRARPLLIATVEMIAQTARRSPMAAIVRASYAVPLQTYQRKMAKTAAVASAMETERPIDQLLRYQRPRPAST